MRCLECSAVGDILGEKNQTGGGELEGGKFLESLERHS